MDRSTFVARLAQGAERSRDFAQEFVLESLPREVRFRVRLNSSNDANLRPEEVVFPEDGSYERAFAVRKCDLATAVDALWRDGRVPEWVNLSVIDRTDSATIVEATSCGRFTDDEELLYHVHEGSPPFHVLGPTRPPGYVEGSRFSVHRCAECWDRSDLDHLREIHPAVWSLELVTDEFDATELAELPSLEAMEILEHRRCSVDGDPLSAVARFNALRKLRIRFTGDARPRITNSTCAPGIAELTLENLPAAAWGFETLSRAIPNARRVELSGERGLWLGGEFAASVESIAVSAHHLEGDVRLPARLDSLSLDLTRLDDSAFAALADGVRSINAVRLRNTAISDDLALSLPDRFGLEFFDIVGTGVRRETVDRLAKTFPGLRLLPNYAASAS